MTEAILVINAGSSSLKFSVFLDSSEDPTLLMHGEIEDIMAQAHFVARDANGTTVDEKTWPPGTALGHRGAMEYFFDWTKTRHLSDHCIKAAGHRVVHGGLEFTSPVLIDAKTMVALEKLVPLAPLHQPYNLEAIRAIMHAMPWLPQVACFDTSFHRTQPKVSQAFALPRRYFEEGIRRYGFHGLSYEYISRILPEFDVKAADGLAILAHLGNGASMCATLQGKSIATTMGFTAVDGLVMGTRCGSIDPGVLLYLMDRHGMDSRAIEKLIYEEAGLLGVSQISGDVRTLLESVDPKASEAIDLFVYRIARELGSLAAALGGLDGIVFTGGIGEHAAIIRSRVCRDAAWLGLELDERANQAGGPLISTVNSLVNAWVIPTNEELMIARHTAAMLRGTG